jgi:hypothetical protein
MAKKQNRRSVIHATNFTLVFAALACQAGWSDDNMGMRIEGITEQDGVVTVVTTGARFQIEPQGTVRFQQRIPREREVLRARLPQATSALRVERPDEFTVTVSDQSASWTIHGDSVAILRLNEDLTIPFDVLITPSYDALNSSGRRLLIDPDGGFGIYPVTPNTSSSRNPSGTLTYSFSRGEEVWLSVFPPRPYNWQRSFEPICHEGTPMRPYPNNALIEAAAQHCKVFTLHAYFWKDDPDDVLDDYGEIVPHPHPWTTPVHVPSDMAEFRRVRDAVHRGGMKFVVYVSPYYSRAPDIIQELRRVLNEYQVDGLYFDGIARDFWNSYAIVRQARQLVGPDGILYFHDSFIRGYADETVYFPFVDTYTDYILRGEAGRQQFELTDFLRWTISGYNISNAVGHWVYYGSNIDDLDGGPECNYDSRVCCENGNQTCYQHKVPSERHIAKAFENEVRIWRASQYWMSRPEEIARFDSQYYDRLESLREAWEQSKHFSADERIQTTASADIMSVPSLSGVRLGSQPPGVSGTIREGPAFGDGFFWWNVSYEDPPNGWSIQGSFAGADSAGRVYPNGSRRGASSRPRLRGHGQE